MTAAQIARALPKCRKAGKGWIVCCPAHEDNNPSLSISEQDGTLLVHCHGPCDQSAVVEALKGLGLWPEYASPKMPTTERRIVATYDYSDAAGQLLYQVVRYLPKDFRPRYSDGAGGWIWKKHPNQVLYQLPEVLEAPIVFVVEGEKDVEKLREHGFVATTNAGGAKALWLPQFTEALRGREVILIPDNDAPGRQRAAAIARALLGQVSKLTALELEDSKDISDWFDRGHSEVKLIACIEEVAHAR
jgi:putative DNA primase/helicase